jgi:hypothetical protein
MWQRSLRVRENAVRRTAVCLEMDGGRFEHIVTMGRLWFDHLIAWAIWRWRVPWKLNVTGHMLYNIFDLFFNKESHYGELVLKFHFIQDKQLILPTILYSVKLELLPWRKKHRLRESEKKVLRRMFVPKIEEVTRGWRKLHETKESLGKPRHRWKDNSKIGLKQIGCEDVNWIYLARYRGQWLSFVNTVLNLRVP